VTLQETFCEIIKNSGTEIKLNPAEPEPKRLCGGMAEPSRNPPNPPGQRGARGDF
jgi:hypothetical protein